jgi:hypothetical protein
MREQNWFASSPAETRGWSVVRPSSAPHPAWRIIFLRTRRDSEAIGAWRERMASVQDGPALRPKYVINMQKCGMILQNSKILREIQSLSLMTSDLTCYDARITSESEADLISIEAATANSARHFLTAVRGQDDRALQAVQVETGTPGKAALAERLGKAGGNRPPPRDISEGHR